MNEIIKEVIKYINDRKDTQRQLAMAAGVSQATISRIVSGEQKNLQQETLRGLKRGLKVLKDREGDGAMSEILLEVIKQQTKRIEELEHKYDRVLAENQELMKQLFDRRLDPMEQDDVSLEANGTTDPKGKR